jgi:choline dehydrogenase-like flavoprotein
MLLHTHPSGVLEPSRADLSVAARLHDGGVGFGIVTNSGDDLYVVVEVPRAKGEARLDAFEVIGDLAEHGAVAKQMGQYEDRPSQRDMAAYIADAYNDGGVLLLEAGGSDRRFYVQLPLGYGKLFYNPAVNWMYQTEPDPGLAGNRDHWPRGKLLGGSSSINAMVWIRGHASDYDDWEAAGNPGWGWASVLPAYRAIEDNEAGGDAWRGSGGPLFISANRRDLHPLCETFIRATEATGLPRNPDFNGAEQEGVGIYQMTIRGARRNSAARAFLRPAMKRPNLRVETRAHVTRVLFEGRRAVGVEYRQGGTLHQVRAR